MEIFVLLEHLVLLKSPNIPFHYLYKCWRISFCFLHALSHWGQYSSNWDGLRTSCPTFGWKQSQGSKPGLVKGSSCYTPLSILGISEPEPPDLAWACLHQGMPGRCSGHAAFTLRLLPGLVGSGWACWMCLSLQADSSGGGIYEGWQVGAEEGKRLQ